MKTCENQKSGGMRLSINKHVTSWSYVIVYLLVLNFVSLLYTFILFYFYGIKQFRLNTHLLINSQ